MNARWVVGLTLMLSLGGTSAVAADELPTKDKPLVVDKVHQRVLIYTETHPMRLYMPNVHWGIVFKDGKMQDRAILRSWAGALEVHDALVEIGAKPGNNLNRETLGKAVAGDELTVTASWAGAGREVPLSELFTDEAGKGFQIRFGGNRPAAAETRTGCIVCLESCWASIASNAAYPQNTGEKIYSQPNSLFKGNVKVLPTKDDAPVIVTLSLKPGRK